MEILPGIFIEDLALFLKKEKILVAGDFHIGYEEALNKNGILIPQLQFSETVQRLDKILKKTKPSLVVINGDLKHEFGTISETEWRQTLHILDLISKYSGEIILIKGNHDTILGPIAKKRNLRVLDEYSTGSAYICHGDIIPKTAAYRKAKLVIIGHEHPAVGLQDGTRLETFKCFLLGSYKGKKLIVMPSFNTVTEGTDVMREKLLSPFLKHGIADFEAFVVADGVYRFGKLKNIGMQ